MNKLTAKQEKFCQCIVSGMTQADAYREAYGQKRLSQKVLWIRASEVAANATHPEYLPGEHEIANAGRGYEHSAPVVCVGFDEGNKIKLVS